VPFSVWIPEGCLDYALASVLKEVSAQKGLRIELRLPAGGSGPGGWRGAVQHSLRLLSGDDNLDVRSVLVFLDADSSACHKISWVAEEIGRRLGLGSVNPRLLSSPGEKALGALFDSLGGDRRLGLVFWCDPSMGASEGNCNCNGKVEDVLMGVLGELYGCRRHSRCYSIKCDRCPSGSSMGRFATVYDKLVGPLGVIACSGSGTLVLAGRDEARCGFDVLGALQRMGVSKSSLTKEYANVVSHLV